MSWGTEPGSMSILDLSFQDLVPLGSGVMLERMGQAERVLDNW